MCASVPGGGRYVLWYGGLNSLETLTVQVSCALEGTDDMWTPVVRLRPQEWAGLVFASGAAVCCGKVIPNSALGYMMVCPWPEVTDDTLTP